MIGGVLGPLAEPVRGWPRRQDCVRGPKGEEGPPGGRGVRRGRPLEGEVGGSVAPRWPSSPRLVGTACSWGHGRAHCGHRGGRLEDKDGATLACRGQVEEGERREGVCRSRDTGQGRRGLIGGSDSEPGRARCWSNQHGGELCCRVTGRRTWSLCGGLGSSRKWQSNSVGGRWDARR